MSSDVECIKCKKKFNRSKTAQKKKCPTCKLAALAVSASDPDLVNDSDNDLTSTAREIMDSMKKVIDRVYEKVIILEQEIVSLKKKNHRRGMYGKAARHYVTLHPKLCTQLQLRWALLPVSIGFEKLIELFQL